jgi:peptidoglycan-associated lipoprotein
MNRMADRIVGSIFLVGASALGGCAHEQTTPVVGPTPADVSTTQTSSGVVATTGSSGVHVSDAILKACNIDFNNVDTAPKFDFDRSNLRPDDRNLLESVAKCVTTGPLQGRALKLVGRADPRVEVEYNFILGGSRAGSVSSYLMDLGVDSSKISVTSRGKLDATGTDEVTWQRDRRVDIDLL